MILDTLIIMGDVSGLAHKSNNFANFLTVSQKYGLACIYIFHTMYRTRQNWQMILSQTKMFNSFPESIQTSSIINVFSLLQVGIRVIMSLNEIFGLIGCITRFQTLDKNNA